MLNNKYVFGKDSDIPSEFIKKLKEDYDWNYEI
jgi:hypothetical protein